RRPSLPRSTLFPYTPLFRSHEPGRGGLVDLRWRAELFDPALVHDGDAVGHGQRFALVVSDVDEGDADLALDAFELQLHGLAQFRSEEHTSELQSRENIVCRL